MRVFLLFISLFICFSSSAYKKKRVFKRPKIGLVLSGGGARGFAHIGVLRVLEEKNIPIDYIVGTSMGAIIGGLYAIGYSPDEIEKMVIAQDWSTVLSDYVDRKYIPLYLKQEHDRYTISFPIRGKSVSLPKGISAGQNITKLLSRFTQPYHKQKNFDKYPIPFACVAANIVNGEEVVMNSGDIVFALRSSMSIPTFFVPMAKNKQLLIDGGMRNNFPVDVAKRMGAKIIIGVDLQQENKTYETLDNMYSIFDQGLSYLGLEKYYKNKKKVDVYVRPKVGDYSITDFNKADTLIKRGYIAASEIVGKLDSIKNLIGPAHPKMQNLKPLRDKDSLYVSKLNIIGLKTISKRSLLGRLNIKEHSYITISKLEESINRAYAALNLKMVRYIFSGKDNTVLNIYIMEKIQNRFNIGLNYNSWKGVSLLMNTTFNNVLGKSRRLSVDLKLAEYPYLGATYSYSRGWRFGFRLHFDAASFNFAQYYNDEKLLYGAKLFRFDANINGLLSQSYSYSLGVRPEFFSFEKRYGSGRYQSISEGKDIALVEDGEKEPLFNYYAQIRMDTHEKTLYPRRGISFFAELMYTTNNGFSYDNKIDYLNTVIKLKKPFAITQNFTLIPSFYFSGSVTRLNETIYGNTFIGMNNLKSSIMNNHIPFVGLKENVAVDNNLYVGRFDLQWEFWKDNYIILAANVMGQTTGFKLPSRDFETGIALTYAYRSPIGPIEISPMWSSLNHLASIFINIGFNF